jgi:NADH-quinone oxidoreductase subunit G
VVKPRGETRPGWKVLRVLGNLLGLPGFSQETSEEVLAEALNEAKVEERLNNRAQLRRDGRSAEPSGGLERIADVPIYGSDPLVRRAPSLQQTADARPPVAFLPERVWRELALSEGSRVRVSQGGASVVLPARLDALMPHNVVRVPTAHPHTAALAPLFGMVTVEKA